ncbi:MAG: citrate/2-methylcitrate synthase, partial [Spirochaetota bacterium]
RPNREYTRLEAETLDLALVLHAEHGGGNNSSFAVHVVSSAGTDTYSAISSACGSLKGPKHGGASGRVAAMMDEVMNGVGAWDDDEEIIAYLRRIAKKEAGDRTGLVYGMGHAVYTLSDPRAVLLKEKARELAAAKGFSERLALYERVEQLTPEVLREVRGRTEPIAANVDFYSGLVYEMLNIPRDLYVPIFAVARVAGWTAHRIEELVSGGRIMRPAYKNILGRREYVPMADRR